MGSSYDEMLDIDCFLLANAVDSVNCCGWYWCHSRRYNSMGNVPWFSIAAFHQQSI